MNYSALIQQNYYFNQQYDKRFENALLYQSILMIMMQVELLRLCLTIMNKSVYKTKPNSFFESPLNKFWRWSQLNSYIACLITFLILIIISSYLNLANPQYWEIIGFLSCAIEATLGLPQAIKNHTAKSVKGLSYAMIGSWFLGDAFKTFYYIVKNQPAQFVMCGVIQIIVDIWIMLQLIEISVIYIYQIIQDVKYIYKNQTVLNIQQIIQFQLYKQQYLVPKKENQQKYDLLWNQYL